MMMNLLDRASRFVDGADPNDTLIGILHDCVEGTLARGGYFGNSVTVTS